MMTKDLLMKFSSLTGVSGMEGEAAEFSKGLLSNYGHVEISALGSVICTVREPEAGRPHVMLDAHLDEIGMIVTFIEEGFLRVRNCGGMDCRLLSASPVLVHTSNGTIHGVICSIPPHLQGTEEKKNPKIEEIYIDVGFSQEESESRICLGDRVTLSSTPTDLRNGLVSGKALDDRAGCVSLVKALEELGSSVPCGLTIVFSSMEEVGGQGAGTAAYQVNPTHAIVVDVSYAHTPDAPREKCGLLGKGPMIGVAPILSRHMSDKLIELAKEQGIPYQIEAMGGKTGTNADQVVAARCGIKTALCSVPQKYMHTPVEVVDTADVELTGRLLALMIREIAGGNI